jgi:hypothetical protein
MVNAYADLSVAYAAYCPAGTTCTANISLFANLADELATTVTTNTSLTNPATVFGTPAILSEPCESQTTPSTWPDGCTIGGPNTNQFSQFLIFKGNFERGAYCSLHNFSDGALRMFIQNNADAIANLPHFGFLWEPGSDANVNFGTRASILDGLEAYIAGSTLMCAGGS